ncbi:hypothetical protein D3C80_1476390 [compost metagenome]
MGAGSIANSVKKASAERKLPCPQWLTTRGWSASPVLHRLSANVVRRAFKTSTSLSTLKGTTSSASGLRKYCCGAAARRMWFGPSQYHRANPWATTAASSWDANACGNTRPSIDSVLR